MTTPTSQTPETAAMCGKDGPKQDCPLEMGYGLAGGGIGAYAYCTREGCDYFEKWPDPEYEHSPKEIPHAE